MSFGIKGNTDWYLLVKMENLNCLILVEPTDLEMVGFSILNEIFSSHFDIWAPLMIYSQYLGNKIL